MVLNICTRLFESLSCKKKRSLDSVLFELESSSVKNGLSNLNPEDLEKTLDSQISAVPSSDSLEFDFKIFHHERMVFILNFLLSVQNFIDS